MVIGILTALGINSLNEERKDKSKAYLERMAEELSELEMTLKEDAKRAFEVQTYLVSSMEILKTSRPSKEQSDTLDFIFINYNQFVRIPQTLTNFEEIKSNGDLGLIYSQDLRKSIGAFLRCLTAISKIYDQLANEFSQLEII